LFAFREGKIKKQQAKMKTVFSASISTYSSEPKQNKATPKIPRGVRALPLTVGSSSPREELTALQQEVAAIDRWWADANRWKNTKRVYTGTCRQDDFFYIEIRVSPSYYPVIPRKLR
jgi:hypothetical protein